MSRKIIAMLVLFFIIIPYPCMAAFLDNVKQFEQKYPEMYGTTDPAIVTLMESFLQDVVSTVVATYQTGDDLNQKINDTVTSLLLGDTRYNQDLLNFLVGQMNNQTAYRQQISEMKALVRSEVEARLAARTTSTSGGGGGSSSSNTSNTSSTSSTASSTSSTSATNTSTTSTANNASTISVNTSSASTLSSSDQKVNLAVPVGAVSVPVSISITPLDNAQIAVPPGLTKIGQTQYKLEAFDAKQQQVKEFQKPLTLQVKYTDQELMPGINENILKVCYKDEKTGQWIALPTSINTATNTATAETSHFTVFMLLAWPGFPSLTDCRDHWAEADIMKLASLKIASGDPNGSFRPETGITREEFAVLVVKARGLSVDNNAVISFADSAGISSWAKPYVAAAVKEGIITGYNDNTFKGKANINRAELAVIAIRAVKETTAQTTLNFNDSGSIPDWARGYIGRAVQKGMISGFPDGSYKAGGTVTRAQAARIVANM